MRVSQLSPQQVPFATPSPNPFSPLKLGGIPKQGAAPHPTPGYLGQFIHFQPTSETVLFLAETISEEVIAFGPRRGFTSRSCIRVPIPGLTQLLGVPNPLVTQGMDLGISPSPTLRFCWRNTFSWRCGKGDRVGVHGRSCCWGCVHTHFWGPSLTSRDWEKFTYTAHFHMSRLRLAEATICAVMQCLGFLPAPHWQGFHLPCRCFIAARVVVSI